MLVSQASWEGNSYAWRVPELYTPRGHHLNGGRPSRWDAYRDPFHTDSSESSHHPVELDVGDNMDPAQDNGRRLALAANYGVEGSWADRKSFLRAHFLLPDKYRKAVVQARALHAREYERDGTGGFEFDGLI